MRLSAIFNLAEKIYKEKKVIPWTEAIEEALAKQGQCEPVAAIGSCFQLLYCRNDWSENLKVGDKLYTAPKPNAQQETLAWICEDELPADYPYDAMYPYSKVDVVRMFPVFGPASCISRSTEGEA